MAKRMFNPPSQHKRQRGRFQVQVMVDWDGGTWMDYREPYFSLQGAKAAVRTYWEIERRKLRHDDVTGFRLIDLHSDDGEVVIKYDVSEGQDRLFDLLKP